MPKAVRAGKCADRIQVQFDLIDIAADTAQTVSIGPLSFFGCFPQLYFSLPCCPLVLCVGQIAGFALFRVTFQTFADYT